jgi:hypothetical protein
MKPAMITSEPDENMVYTVFAEKDQSPLCFNQLIAITIASQAIYNPRGKNR